MSIVLPPVFIGVYKDEFMARKAVDKLYNEKFSQEQIGILMHEGGLLTSGIRNSLISIGVPEEEANIYEQEFEAGNFIVLVRHEGRIQEAFNSLYTINITSLSVSSQKESEEQIKTFENDQIVMDSLWKMLKDAGLDHLL